MANNCHLPVNFEFRGKGGGGSKICESWLSVEPTRGELITGDSLSIRFKLFVDVHTAYRMHRKQKSSNIKGPLDILVLHVDNGRDIFITIIGEYRPSCFGFSVETLTRLTLPVYDMDLKDLLTLVSALAILNRYEIFSILIEYISLILCRRIARTVIINSRAVPKDVAESMYQERFICSSIICIKLD